MVEESAAAEFKKLHVDLAHVDGRLESLSVLLNERTQRIEDRIVAAAREWQQHALLISEATSRLETNQTDQGKRLRVLEEEAISGRGTAARIERTDVAVERLDVRVTELENALIGFRASIKAVGVMGSAMGALIGGGAGAAVVAIFGGG